MLPALRRIGAHAVSALFMLHLVHSMIPFLIAECVQTPVLQIHAYPQFSLGVSGEGCLGPSRSVPGAHGRWMSDRGPLPSQSLAAGLPMPCRCRGPGWKQAVCLGPSHCEA